MHQIKVQSLIYLTLACGPNALWVRTVAVSDKVLFKRCSDLNWNFEILNKFLTLENKNNGLWRGNYNKKQQIDSYPNIRSESVTAGHLAVNGVNTKATHKVKQLKPMNMQMLWPSETAQAITQTTQRNIPEDTKLHQRRCEDLKCETALFLLLFLFWEKKLVCQCRHTPCGQNV